MAVCLPRYLGPVETLPAGMWAMSTRGPVVACRGCGGIDYIDIDHIGASGVVTPRHDCPTVTCSASDFVVLESWGECSD